MALATTLDLIDEIDNSVRPDDKTRTVRLIGPNFSGSQHSLQATIRNWESKHLNDDLIRTISIISGGATAFDQGQFKQDALCPDKRKFVRQFKATVHTSEFLRETILQYVDEKDRVAMLVESNTGFGRKQSTNESGVIEYPFPMNVREICRSYEQKDLLNDRGEERLPLAEHLTMHPSREGNQRDTIPPFTPDTSAAIDELSLSQNTHRPVQEEDSNGRNRGHRPARHHISGTNGPKILPGRSALHDPGRPSLHATGEYRRPARNAGRNDLPPLPAQSSAVISIRGGETRSSL